MSVSPRTSIRSSNPLKVPSDTRTGLSACWAQDQAGAHRFEAVNDQGGHPSRVVPGVVVFERSVCNILSTGDGRNLPRVPQPTTARCRAVEQGQRRAFDDNAADGQKRRNVGSALVPDDQAFTHERDPREQPSFESREFHLAFELVGEQLLNPFAQRR